MRIPITGQLAHLSGSMSIAGRLFTCQNGYRLEKVLGFVFAILAYVFAGAVGWYVLPIVWAWQDHEPMTSQSIQRERWEGILFYGAIGLAIGVSSCWNWIKQRREEREAELYETTEAVSPIISENIHPAVLEYFDGQEQEILARWAARRAAQERSNSEEL